MLTLCGLCPSGASEKQNLVGRTKSNKRLWQCEATTWVPVLVAAVLASVCSEWTIAAEPGQKGVTPSWVEALIDEASKYSFVGYPRSAFGPPTKQAAERAEAAKGELVAMGQEVVPVLIARVRDGRADSVSGIFRDLAPTGVAELCGLLQAAEDPTTRFHAARILGRLRSGIDQPVDGRVLHALRTAATVDPSGVVRAQALSCIVDALRCEAGQEVLLHALADEHADVRRVAVHAVYQEFETQRAAGILKPMLQDPADPVWEAVALELGRRRQVIAIDALVRALLSERPHVSSRAERVLEGWFYQRFRGSGQGQANEDEEVCKLWTNWWEENKRNIHKGFTLTVRQGDTLSQIGTTVYDKHAKRQYTLEQRWRAIQRANGGVEPTQLKVGMTLFIPALPSEVESQR